MPGSVRASGLYFLEANSSFEDSEIVLIGLPFDGTVSFRPGARFGPNAVREASQSIESFSPRFSRDLLEMKIHDTGDLELPHGDALAAVNAIEKTSERIFKAGKKVISIGGEHLVSLGLARAAGKRHRNLHFIAIDAHLDLRDDYMGVRFSHATVFARIIDLVGEKRVLHLGARSGTREEFERASRGGFGFRWDPDAVSKVESLEKKANIYLSVDLDVFDPSLIPGVGNPEPGGISLGDFIGLIKALKGREVVGVDFCELCPMLDPSLVSSVFTAHIIRETILALF